MKWASFWVAAIVIAATCGCGQSGPTNEEREATRQLRFAEFAMQRGDQDEALSFAESSLASFENEPARKLYTKLMTDRDAARRKELEVDGYKKTLAARKEIRDAKIEAIRLEARKRGLSGDKLEMAVYEQTRELLTADLELTDGELEAFSAPSGK
jgi:hypothetical protein